MVANLALMLNDGSRFLFFGRVFKIES